MSGMEQPDGGDRHHCRCFWIGRREIRRFRDLLAGIGFEEQLLEENHGQVFGMRRTISEQEQVHIKVMPDGWIESEIEPPPEYPLAHVNPAHSYSSHDEVLGILHECRIGFRMVADVPEPCLNPTVKRPNKPTHWKTIVGAVSVVALTLLGAYIASKLKPQPGPATGSRG